MEIRTGTTDTGNNSTSTRLVINWGWGSPERVEVNVYGETIEMVYKEQSSPNYYPLPTLYRVYKIVYSCIDGKWNKSEPIYGKIIPAQEESFEFED
jgi:hypothetical protein